jgi:Ca2+-binding EF-hand superfamily protein
MLKKTVTSFIVSNLLSTKDLRTLQTLFSEYDTDKNGTLDRNELMQLLKSEMPEADAEARCNDIFKHIDTDNNGEIDFNEFVSAGANRDLIYSDHNIKLAFDLIDRDKSGTISLDEIQFILDDPDNNYTNTWLLMLKEALGEEKELNFSVFKDLMLKHKRV